MTHVWLFTFGAGDHGAACVNCGVARYSGANVPIDPSGGCSPVTTSHDWQLATPGGLLRAGCGQCGTVLMGRVREAWDPGYLNAPTIDLGGECPALAVPA